jgi:tripartite-type tricarboxylate transporter receptor subunit TctC
MKKVGLALALVWLTAGSAAAQTAYPVRPVTLVVPFAAGGPLDIVARIVSDVMSAHLGQPIVIENVTGAGGTIGATRVARAVADGYTLLLYHIGAATTPALYKGRLAYDTMRDLAPVTLVNEVPMILVARKDLPVRSLAEFAALIRAQTKRLNVAHAGVGSASHLCALLLMNELNVEVTTVPYRGTSPAMNDLISGQMDAICDLVTNAAPQVQAGKINAYAITGDARVPALKDVPTAREAGLPGLDMTNWNAIFAPRDTPQPVIDRLLVAVSAALNDPGVASRFAAIGTKPIEPARRGTANLRSHLQSETARWTPLIERSGQFAE